MKLRLPSAVAALALGLSPLAVPLAACADIVVNVDQGASAPVPIAIPAFPGSPVGAQMQAVIAGDLARSGLFKPLDPATFPTAAPEVNAQPAFDGWKAISAQGLLTGQVLTDPQGRLVVNFRLWDVYAGDQLVGLQFSSAPGAWRHIAHKIADAVYEKLTGQAGYFDTRVVFVSETGPRGRRTRKLEIMDQDGANPSVLTDGSAQAFFPSIAADNRHVAYMALRQTGSTLYDIDLDSGHQQAISHFQGMVFAPRFSADASKVVFSAEREGNTDIYVMGRGGGGAVRLTHDPAIDTSPCFSPDGGQVAFNSDRGGSPQIYVMGADGGGVHRISFGGGRYTTPVWSPDGKYIAFTKQEGAQFHIGVMKPDGSQEKILTTSYLDEGPTWAPNSRVIMFSRDTGYGAHLWTVDISGRLEAAAPYPLNASDPSWSALLP